MAEIFISYSRDDRDTAHALAVALEAADIAVWWDRELTGGGDFAAEIERHLKAAPIVIVLWSHSSVVSDFVRDESSRARDLRKLLPVRIEDVPLPLGFGTLHTLDLIDWDGDPDDDALIALLSQIRQRLKEAAKPTSKPGGSPIIGSQRSNKTLDPLTRRRRQRRWVIGLGVAGIAAAGGVGWTIVADSRRERELARQAERKNAAQAHLDTALSHHFADPPDFKRAEIEYRLATKNDPTLAAAFFYWGHLTIALLDQKQPKPSPAERAGLRKDALERFRQSLQFKEDLGEGPAAVANQQIASLAADEPAPLERSTDAELVAVLATTPEPTAAAIPDEPRPTTRPLVVPNSTSSQPPQSGIGAMTGAATGAILGGLGAFGIGTNKPPTQTSRPATKTPRPAPPPPKPPKPVDPRIAADQELEQRAAAEAKALFAADRDGRLGARSVLASNPDLAAEALPAALAAAQASLAAPGADATARAGLAATVQLIDNATPAVVLANRKAIETLQSGLVAHSELAPAESAATLAAALQRSAGSRPAVFVQIANDQQRPLAEQLLKRFDAAGYASAQIENVGEKRAPSRPEVRSHGGSDPGMARWCKQKLSELTGTTAVLQNLRNIRPDNDVFEIWFDAALCAPGGRRVAGCGEA